MRPYSLTPQVMNGTGALRQFVPRVARHSSRATLAIGQRQSLEVVARLESATAGPQLAAVVQSWVDSLPLPHAAANSRRCSAA